MKGAKVFTRLELDPSYFWPFVSCVGLALQFIFNMALKWVRAHQFARELCQGGIYASSAAVGIAFSGQVPFLPLEFKHVSDPAALGWIVVFWTVCLAVPGLNAITRTLRASVLKSES
jgi:hypothetical protein